MFARSSVGIVQCDLSVVTLCLLQQDPGVIPRLCRGLFEAIEALDQGKTVAVVASYVEVCKRFVTSQQQ